MTASMTQVVHEWHEKRLRSVGREEDTAPRASLSQAMWGLDWSVHLPTRLTDDGIVVQRSSYAEASPFIGAKFAAMFEEDPAESPFLHVSATEAKRRYYRLCADFFAFMHAETIVGALVCNPVDWSTYYIRFCAFLPEYQGRQLLQRFFPEFFRILKQSGVERIETETSPSNLAVMHMMNRFRFNHSGTILSERWGSLVRFTKFLDERCEDVFLRQYCTGIRYQARTK
jgi:hypothetical protein